MRVALVHDYLTQRGGAERVVAFMLRAFPHAPLHTSLFEPAATFPEFSAAAVSVSPLNRAGILRRNHRLALPLLAAAFSHLRVDADVTLCSSSGWAHGAWVSGRKVVYCHNVARWLYQRSDYLRGRQRIGAPVMALAGPRLRYWDQAAAGSADRYLVNSRVVRERVRQSYGRDAEILPPPPAISPYGPVEPIDAVEEGFVLCVSRLLSYKHVDRVVAAFSRLPDERLVVVGSGPEESALRQQMGRNVTLLGSVNDAQLRWLYGSCRLLVASSYEDFGLTPLEAAGFGKPTVALRYGGYLDTIAEGQSGVYFDKPEPVLIAGVLADALSSGWSSAAIEKHAEIFGEDRFMSRLQAIVAEEARS